MTDNGWYGIKPNQTKPFNSVLKNELWLLKCYEQTICLQIIYTFMCVEDLALNNLQGLICHKNLQANIPM